MDYKKAGLYSRAEEAFKKALELNPLDKQAHKFLEEVYEDNKDWESLARWQKRFGSEDNVVAHLYTEWGKKLFADGDLDKAQEKLKKPLTVMRAVWMLVYGWEKYIWQKINRKKHMRYGEK